MNRSLLRGSLLAPAFLLLYSLCTFAQGQFVYVNSNTVGLNAVSAFSVDADCSLTFINTYPTGGSGTSLSNFGVNLMEVCGENLYVANIGSNTITVFAINPATGALTTIGSQVPVPGAQNMAIACSPDRRFLYVARSGTSNVSLFTRASDGSLSFVQTVLSGGLAPVDIEVSPDGTFLLVSNVLSPNVVPFAINPADGTLTQGSPAPTITAPVEIEINCAGTLAFVSSTGGVNVFSIGAGGALTRLPGAFFDPLGDDFNIRLSPDGRFLFVSHFNSNSVSVLNVAADGTLSEITSSPFPNTGGTLPQPIVTNASGTCLFAFNTSFGATAFSIASDGVLARVGQPTGGSFLTGGIAAYPPASCQADLSVSKSVSSTGVVGSTATYEISVINQGPAVAANVVVQDILPPGTSFVAGTCMTLVNSSAAGTCQVVGDNLTAAFPSLAVGEVATVKYTVIITAQGGALGTLTNAVSVSSDNPDPDPNDNTTSVPLQVFDVCLQDDSNSATVFLGNSTTGDYRFCCGGAVFTGRARVVRKGSTVTFEHNTSDRRVLAKADRSVFRGTASLQSPPGSLRCTITDRDIRNNSCLCVPVSDTLLPR
jgi:uncharacterized repeat protein (TIGR01451 family)